MLTVLVRHKDTGVESIYQAESVDFVPRNTEDSTRSQVILNGENMGRNIKFDGNDPQTVYVMNEAGQTVARYQL